MPPREWHICAAGAEPGQDRRPASDGDRDSGVERRRRTRPDHPAAWAVGPYNRALALTLRDLLGRAGWVGAAAWMHNDRRGPARRRVQAIGGPCLPG